MRTGVWIIAMIGAAACNHPPVPPVKPAPKAARIEQAPTPPSFSAMDLGFVLAGVAKDAYVAELDPSTIHEGRATTLFHAKRSATGVATLYRKEGVEKYAGQRVRLSAFVKTLAATDRVEIWGRVTVPGQGKNKADHVPFWGEANSEYRSLHANHDFLLYQIVLDVPPDAESIELGVGLGGGALWLDDAKIQTVPKSVPLTKKEPVDGWVLSGGGVDEFELAVDPSVRYKGAPSVLLASGLPVIEDRADAWKRVDVSAFRGKGVRVSFDVRTEHATGHIFAATRDDRFLFVTRSGGAKIEGTSDFTKRVLRLEVRSTATWLDYGVTLTAPGRAWIGEVIVEAE